MASVLTINFQCAPVAANVELEKLEQAEYKKDFFFSEVGNFRPEVK